MVAPEIVKLKGDVELIVLHDAAERFAKSYSGSLSVELDTTGSNRHKRQCLANRRARPR